MAAVVGSTSKKIILDLEEGTQTITPIINAATDEKAYAVAEAVSTLVDSTIQGIQLVETQTIVEEG